MPKDIFGKDHQFLRKDELLSYEEIIEIVKILKDYGLQKVRLTGGEPMLRKNIELLIDDNDPITKKVKIPAKMTLII